MNRHESQAQGTQFQIQTVIRVERSEHHVAICTCAQNNRTMPRLAALNCIIMAQGQIQLHVESTPLIII